MAEDGMEDEGSEGSSEGSMDDEQMMAIDEKLAAVFRTRQEERKKGKGPHTLPNFQCCGLLK